MSGVDFVIDVPYTGPIVGFIPPVSAGLQGLWFPGVSDTEAVRNYYGGTGSVGNATIVGAPTYDADGAACKAATNYFQTAAAEAGSMTIFAAIDSIDTPSNSDSALNAMVLGNTFGSSTGGAAIYFQGLNGSNQGLLRAVATYTVSGSPLAVVVQQAVADFTKIRLVSLTITEGVGFELRDWTDGTTVSAAQAGARLLDTSNRKFRLGSSQRSDFQGRNHIAAAEIHTGVLSAGDQAKVAAGIRSFLSQRRGITV